MTWVTLVELTEKKKCGDFVWVFAVCMSCLLNSFFFLMCYRHAFFVIYYLNLCARGLWCAYAKIGKKYINNNCSNEIVNGFEWIFLKCTAFTRTFFFLFRKKNDCHSHFICIRELWIEMRHVYGTSSAVTQTNSTISSRSNQNLNDKTISMNFRVSKRGRKKTFDKFSSVNNA